MNKSTSVLPKSNNALILQSRDSIKGVSLTVCFVFDPHYCNSINKHHLCETQLFVT